MECKFQIGDPVVCIEEFDWLQQFLADHKGPVLDEIYHIRALGLCDCGQNHVVVSLKEIVLRIMSRKELMIGHERFRKLITPEDFMSKDISAPVDSGDKVVEHV